MHAVAGATFVAFAIMAAAEDLRFRRIPNWLTVTGAALGVGLAAILSPSSLPQAIEGLCAGLVVGFLLYVTHAVGAGDAKFLAAVSAWAGLERLPAAWLMMLSGGAVFALAWSLKHRILKATLASTSAMIGAAVSSGQGLPAMMGSTRAGKFPYGVGLSLGAVAWWLWAGRVLP